MPVKDTQLDPQDKSYRISQHPGDLLIVERRVSITYKKSYGGISIYFQNIGKGSDSVLYYSVCRNAEQHDGNDTLRFQVPRSDCPECWEKTEWTPLPDGTHFTVETKSTAVELAGISFMDHLPVTVAWILAVLPDGNALNTLAAGMVHIDEYNTLVKGDSLRPVFRREPQASASDVMWVPKGTQPAKLPTGYVPSRHYAL